MVSTKAQLGFSMRLFCCCLRLGFQRDHRLVWLGDFLEKCTTNIEIIWIFQNTVQNKWYLIFDNEYIQKKTHQWETGFKQLTVLCLHNIVHFWISIEVCLRWEYNNNNDKGQDDFDEIQISAVCICKFIGHNCFWG